MNNLTLFDALFVALISLKLAGFIDWSWALVLAPLYMPPIIVAIVRTIKEYMENK